MKQQNKQCLLVLGFALSMAAAASAQGTYTPVHPFDQYKDGFSPQNPGMLAQGFDGNVYGTIPSQLASWSMPPMRTQISGWGTLIQFSPVTGTFTPFNFTGNGGGNSPLSGVSLGLDGTLFGATEWGGVGTTTTTPGNGTVFSFSPGTSGNPAALYLFSNGNDGVTPEAPPVQAQDGSLWGTTYGNSAAWYKLNTSGTLVNWGTLPYRTQAPFTLGAGSDTNLYGTTSMGGVGNEGTVFKLSSGGGTPTILHSFDAPMDPNDGQDPLGPVIVGNDGFLYGTTCGGGKNTGGPGTVYRVSRVGTSYSVIHNFEEDTMVHEGACPKAGVIQASDGMLYGVTSTGGGMNYSGTLFRLNTDGTGFQVLHSFDKAGGWTPYSNLMQHTNGTIFGMTSAGGNGYGVLFSYNANLPPFAHLITPFQGAVGSVLTIIGQGFTNTTSVIVGGVTLTPTKLSHPYTIISDTEIKVTVPAGAKTGPITIVETTQTLVTREPFILTSCNPFITRCL